MIDNKYLLNSNNEKIFVETYIPDKIKATIFFCHGITGCRKGRTMEDSYFQDLAKKLMNSNFKVVLFDFSGHGESEGHDYDVTLSKSVDELNIVFKSEAIKELPVKFLAFSYGAIVLCQFLKQNENINPQKIVLYSPCLYPNDSCFLNKDSIFGKDIVNGFNSNNKYIIIGAKNFKFGIKMINECSNITPNYFERFSDKILVLSGTNDLILNKQYNDDFCKLNNISHVYFDASHSLYEKIDDVIKKTIEYFNN